MLPRAECAARVRRAPGTIARRVDGQCIPAHISPVNEGVAFAAEDGTGPGYRSAPDRQRQPPQTYRSKQSAGRRIVRGEQGETCGRRSHQAGSRASGLGTNERGRSGGPVTGDPSDFVYRRENAEDRPPSGGQRVVPSALDPCVHLELHGQRSHRIHQSVFRPAAHSPEVIRGELLEIFLDGTHAGSSRCPASASEERFKVPGRPRPDSLHPQ